MRSPVPLYPVDRYLVPSNMNNELVNIINEDIWNPEPALRPEDEITLRKLHEMLRSTADDLKLLSGELAKYHGPGIQIKSAPTPLDEEFNEKVHIEEVVNAKFHGYKIIDSKNKCIPSKILQKNVVDGLMKTIADKHKSKDLVTTGVQVDKTLVKRNKDKKNLVKSQTKILQINNSKENVNNNKSNISSGVSYNEFCYTYVEPMIEMQSNKHLQLQELPSVNIRSELKVQHVVKLDILPENFDNMKNTSDNNIAVIEIKHKAENIKDLPIVSTPYKKTFNRKISKMKTYESSTSSDNTKTERKPKVQIKRKKGSLYISPSVSSKNKVFSKSDLLIKQQDTFPQTSLKDWERKLKAVYGRSPSSKAHMLHLKSKEETSVSFEQESATNKASLQSSLNNVEYIPYSKLTLGGVSVRDIEKELSNVPNRADMPLQPILDKILNSRENSFLKDSPKNENKTNSKKILSTSDENLLKEVLDIQNKVSNTLSENIENNPSYSGDNDTYADDFDDAKTNTSIHSLQLSDAKISTNSETSAKANKNEIKNPNTVEDQKYDANPNKCNIKSNSLSFKNSVDVFEYVHLIDTQDSATQSNIPHKISLKETQTSPRNDQSNITPIHNDLWPIKDPANGIENMFKLEKEFIKKLMIDEYGDLIEKNFNKPSTSGISERNVERNENASQKNTQTSPAHVKSVMTSPTRTKTRTTSPFALPLKVNQQISPIIVPNNAVENIKNEDELSISMNLSSPRFSLRLPQTSRVVISNFDTLGKREKSRVMSQNQGKPTITSSSSVDGDYSSSDISSLGEIERKYKQMYKNFTQSITSEHTSTASSKQSLELSSTIKPLKSEGEISLGQVKKIVRKNKVNKSEGEMSLGELLDKFK